ncbi:Acetyltransferase, ribosomal protein N-acetylase [Pseudomonas reidholzensis]|uniref:Acetyltransferase, ribosomal protein N-acetylase n=1 Tax=Pseudomonas reidholzensis TaxID=1785162 RepID=A0A383RSV4_9PSED|nr:GNAT family N-acetyltransferase [Pseudomonas reidholzensis]SYX90160.1 Acetyltransferase, ribosomal protein N-acetylase [Pseudomonas reidholzensis]
MPVLTPYPELPETLDSARLRVTRPDAALAPQVHQALSSSYALHQPFLVWAKPDWTLDDIRQSLDKSQIDFLAPTGEKRFFVLTPQGDAVIGCVGLTPRDGEYEVGYWVSQGFAGQGLMREALEMLLDALEVPVWLTTALDNSASQRLAERVGFSKVGETPREIDPTTPGLLYRRAPVQRG